MGIILVPICIFFAIRRADACGVPRRTAVLWSIWGPIGLFLFYRRYPLGTDAAHATQPGSSIGQKGRVQPAKVLIGVVVGAVIIASVSSVSSGSGGGSGGLVVLGVLFFVVWFAAVAGIFTAALGAVGGVVSVVQETLKKSRSQNKNVETSTARSIAPGSKAADVLPPIARDIGSRASGAYALWVILVSTKFLDGTWSESDWLTHVISGNRSTGRFEKVALPFGDDVLREKFDATIQEVLLLFELTFAYQKGYTSFVSARAQRARSSGVFGNVDNFLEWFERAAQTRPSPAVTGAQQAEILEQRDQLADLLATHNPSVVHAVYVNATELTFTA